MKTFAAFVVALIAWLVWSFGVWLSNAHAETLHRGKVYKTTADQIIAQRQLVCTYAKGSTRVETDSKGRTVVIMGKVCTEVSR